MSNGGTAVHLATFEDSEANGGVAHLDSGSEEDVDDSDEEGVRSLLRPEGYMRELGHRDGVRGVWPMVRELVLEVSLQSS